MFSSLSFLRLEMVSAPPRYPCRPLQKFYAKVYIVALPLPPTVTWVYKAWEVETTPGRPEQQLKLPEPYVLDSTILTAAGYDTKGRPQVGQL
uniref:Uncharacterized protein n=1 Tax=Oryza glumipatula TaxID=40148 RepID=A0A0E0B7F5_9ORYZ